MPLWPEETHAFGFPTGHLEDVRAIFSEEGWGTPCLAAGTLGSKECTAESKTLLGGLQSPLEGLWTGRVETADIWGKHTSPDTITFQVCFFPTMSHPPGAGQGNVTSENRYSSSRGKIQGRLMKKARGPNCKAGLRRAVGFYMSLLPLARLTVHCLILITRVESSAASTPNPAEIRSQESTACQGPPPKVPSPFLDSRWLKPKRIPMH